MGSLANAQKPRQMDGHAHKTVTVGPMDQQTHVQVERGYFRLRTDGRTTRKPGLGSIQFRNWNCSSIPIPIPELELELKLVELKMELELKTLELELELELKTGIEFFATATAAITS